MTNLERYDKVLRSTLGAAQEELNDEKLVYNRHPGWDSMAHMDMVTELESEFGVRFGTIDITSFNTYSAGIRILKRLGVAF